MKKIWIKLAVKVAAILIDALMEEFKKKNSEIYQVVADNFCNVLLEQMARDVEKRNRQLEESVERVRSQRSEQKGGE